MTYRAILVLVFVLLGGPFSYRAPADVTMSNLFSDHMVLQREMSVPIWGRASAGEEVTVSFGGQTKSVKTDGTGAWRVVLDPMTASSASRPMRIAGKNQITITDILVGEVWLCSGQSNMQWTFDAKHGVDNNSQEIAGGNYPLIRHNNYPRGDGKWTVITPQTMPLMSAVPYFFSRALYQKLHIPIGILNRSNGGTTVESWSSTKALKETAWGRELLAFADTDAMKAYEVAGKVFGEQMNAWKKNNGPVDAKPLLTVPPDVLYYGLREPYNLPGSMYRQAIQPIACYAIRGEAWYQGESNTESNLVRLNSYAEMFSHMMEDWRAEWGEGSFPVICVQLPNNGRSASTGYDPSGAWPFLREQIANIAEETPNTSYIVTIDTAGNNAPLHPLHKVEVGNRLALRAFQDVYGIKNVVSYGPTYLSVKVEGAALRVQFDHCDGGLKVKGTCLGCFVIAGIDRNFFPAQAEIKGNDVVVSSDRVKRPVAIRYAWANNPPVDLVNGFNLPAAPFRTDTWEIPELDKSRPRLGLATTPATVIIK